MMINGAQVMNYLNLEGFHCFTSLNIFLIWFVVIVLSLD